MKQRLLTAVIGILVLVPILLFSETVVMPIAVALFAGLGVWEMLSCIGVRKKLEITIPTMLFTVGTSFFARYIAAASGRYSYYLAVFAAISFVYMFYLMVLAVISKGTKQIGDMSLVCLTTFYITIGFTSVQLLRDHAFGEILYLMVFIGAWIPDAAAYFCGRAFGKHKLIPDVSPKKTVEGAIGGIIFGGVTFVIFGIIIGALGLAEPRYIELLAAGLVVSVISIFGDLIASLIKRQYGIKDYGKLFPGHGGVLDRFDSIIAIAPFLLMICSYPGIFSLFR